MAVPEVLGDVEVAPSGTRPPCGISLASYSPVELQHAHAGGGAGEAGRPLPGW